MTMAEEMDPMGNTSHANDFQANSNINNNNSLTTNNNMPWKQRKRKRLSAVLDKLHNNNNNNSHHHHNNDSNNNNNNNNNSNNSSNSSNSLGESSAEMKHSPHSSNEYHHHKMSTESIKSSVDDEDERTTVASDDLHSNVDSPIVKRERFSSPLHFAVNDENGPSAEQIKLEDRMSDYDGNRSELNVSPMDRYFPQMPSPLFEYYLQTKYLPEILRMRGTRSNYLTNMSNVSAVDVPLNDSGSSDMAATESHQSQRTAPPAPVPLPPPARKRQRQSKQQSSYAAIPENFPPQDAPLDLSMKTICESIKKATALAKKAAAASAVLQQQQTNAVNQWRSHDMAGQMAPIYPNILSNAGQLGKFTHHSPLATANGLGQVPIIKGDVASPTTKESVAFRYNLDVSPVVEEMPPGNDVAYVCPICGQMFSLHDRLAKHMASRHKSKSNSTEITKSYVCEVCDRSFARSDMLTRHMRLHTGIKPYTCKVCSQVFSRSDHLSTHQRTHTGEKPYKCPQCPYAACRRDMITRHMRTHARYEAQRAAAAAGATNSSESGAHVGKGRAPLSPTMANEISKVTIKIETNHSNTSPTTSRYAVTDEQLHSYHHHHHHHQFNNNSSRNNNNFLLNHHHILSHPADDMVSAATSVANTIIKTENTLLKIQ